MMTEYWIPKDINFLWAMGVLLATTFTILVISGLFLMMYYKPESLKIAQVWAEKSVMVDESAENTYTLAKLLYKNGKKEMARDYAKLSKIIAENTNQNTQYIDTLIQEMK